MVFVFYVPLAHSDLLMRLDVSQKLQRHGVKCYLLYGSSSERANNFFCPLRWVRNYITELTLAAAAASVCFCDALALIEKNQ